MDIPWLISQMAAGSARALSRAITLVENRAPGWRAIMGELYSRTGGAVTVGITGHPGAGKSTLTAGIAAQLAERGHQVGIVAIDPSSSLTGGAFLGDRVRMGDLGQREGVFIRSMSSRGTVGGIAPAARDVIKLLDAFGKDFILVETVGVGQDETEIRQTTQMVVLVCAPGQGDAMQYLKAGVLEIADLYVANKSDLPEADHLLNHLRGLVLPAAPGAVGHRAIVATNALSGEGIPELVERMEGLAALPELRRAWRRRLAAEDLRSLLRERLAQLASLDWVDEAEMTEMINALLEGRAEPYTLSDRVLGRGLAEIKALDPA